MKNSHLFEGMTDEEIQKALDESGTLEYFSDMSNDDIAAAIPNDQFGQMIKDAIDKAESEDRDHEVGERLLKLHVNFFDNDRRSQSDLWGWGLMVNQYMARCAAKLLKGASQKEAFNLSKKSGAKKQNKPLEAAKDLIRELRNNAGIPITRHSRPEPEELVRERVAIKWDYADGESLRAMCNKNGKALLLQAEKELRLEQIKDSISLDDILD
jgi:hypothetical protein